MNEALQQALIRLALKFPEALQQFLSLYFRLEIEGYEHLPEGGRAIVVPNHSDAMGFDAFMLGYVLKHRLRRIPRIMTHDFWFSHPLLAQLSSAYGLFRADLREGLRHLKQNRLIAIFPEGAEGNFKVSSSMYRLVEFNPGFVPLAIMQKAPVVPTVIIGAEETHYNLARLHIFQDVLKEPIPVPLNILPLPAKWKIKFLKPIDFSKYSKKDIKDARFVKEINQNIRYRIQHEINKEKRKRTGLVFS